MPDFEKDDCVEIVRPDYDVDAIRTGDVGIVFKVSAARVTVDFIKIGDLRTAAFDSDDIAAAACPRGLRVRIRNKRARRG